MKLILICLLTYFWFLDGSYITISTCPVKQGGNPIYEIDLSGTYGDPNPLIVGTPVLFHVDGVMHENEFVK